MQNWTESSLRHVGLMPATRRGWEVPEIFRERVAELFALADAELAQPVRGVTTDGTVQAGLFGNAAKAKTGTGEIRNAALAFAATLDPTARAKLYLPFDSPDWRTWINVHMDFFRHGVTLNDLDNRGRARALGLVRATLSARAFAQLRDVMRLNELLVLLGGSTEEFGEWLYNIAFFGDPAGDAPWGWQLDGHHLAVNCVVAGDEITITPAFMGSEPVRVTADDAVAVQRGQFLTTDISRFVGIEVFGPEERAGADLIGSLTADQREQAVAFPSLMPDQLPEHYQHWYNGRVQGGPLCDNLVLPYQGLRGAELTAAQRTTLTQAMAVYLGWARAEHASVRLDQAVDHLDDTWFTWFGGTGPQDPFYYRIHSPVVLIEFDHHKGVVFDTMAPTRNHIHTLVRTPNGGDYGVDLLARHYAAAHPRPPQ
ncbi:MAG TPA: DUF3500 domain-containing protein [Trebonia sp.]|nr:DUF3500 domain-containing protein [Trebonia sp.]